MGRAKREPNFKIAMHLLNTYRNATRSDEPITLDLAWVPIARLVDSTVEDLDALLDGHDVNVQHLRLVPAETGAVFHLTVPCGQPEDGG